MEKQYNWRDPKELNPLDIDDVILSLKKFTHGADCSEITREILIKRIKENCPTMKEENKNILSTYKIRELMELNNTINPKIVNTILYSHWENNPLNSSVIRLGRKREKNMSPNWFIIKTKNSQKEISTKTYSSVLKTESQNQSISVSELIDRSQIDMIKNKVKQFHIKLFIDMTTFTDNKLYGENIFPFAKTETNCVKNSRIQNFPSGSIVTNMSCVLAQLTLLDIPIIKYIILSTSKEFNDVIDFVKLRNNRSAFIVNNYEDLYILVTSF